MFGFFVARQVRNSAQLLHQMYCFALNDECFPSNPVRFFQGHPFLIREISPPHDYPEIGHRFQFSQELSPFTFTVGNATPDKLFVAVSGSGAFDGFEMQSSAPGRYLVRLDLPIARPVGKHAFPLLRHFFRAYDAADITLPGDFRRFKNRVYVR